MKVNIFTAHAGGPMAFDVSGCYVGNAGELITECPAGIVRTIFAAGEWLSATIADKEPAYSTPDSTPGQMLNHFHSVFGNVDDDDLRLRLIKEEVKELKEAMEADDIVEIADAVADICYVAIGTATVKGIPFDKVFAEVHRSNMTKMGADGKPVKRADGKIIKGPNFEHPRIAEILAKEGVIH